MQLRTICYLFALIVLSVPIAVGQDVPFGNPAPLGSAAEGAISPRYFGPTYQGFGFYGFGTYGPGFYGPGASGLRVGPPSAMSIDPSLRFHTYPGYSPPYVQPLPPNSGLPSISDPLRTLPVTWPSRGKININLSAEATGDISYTLNGVNYTIKPGYAQNFDDDRKWIISYEDSETKKPIRYTLTAGTYRFLPNKSGFGLHEVVDKTASGGQITPSNP